MIVSHAYLYEYDWAEYPHTPCFILSIFFFFLQQVSCRKPDGDDWCSRLNSGLPKRSSSNPYKLWIIFFEKMTFVDIIKLRIWDEGIILDNLGGLIKFHHKCLYKRKTTENNTQRKDGNVKTEEEIVVVHPQAQECWCSCQQLEEARGNSFLDSLEKDQFSHSVASDSLWPHGLQHARLPCPSSSLGACSNSCPSSWWCHLTISSSVIPFSSCLQSFPASGSFSMSK